ncbi:MAG TPA: glycosyltransferase [Acidimicrobiales bacterium]|nr:glycosyltransferase [Acidimicrobiales bacterium]
MTRIEGADSPEPAAASALTLSLVIPAYNEGARLEEGVARLRHAVSAGAIAAAATEFVVVDDGSSDDTAARAAELFSPFPHVKVVRLPENRGKGAAVRAGVAAATAPVIAFADADMSIDPAQTPEFMAALAGADLAIGSRAASGASVNRSSLRRSVMNRVFNRLVNAVTRVSLDDTQCGFKAFRAPAAKLLFHCTVVERFAFDVEVLALSRRLGLSIAEVPVHWLRVKGSRIRPWFDAVSMARDVVRAGRGARSAPPVETLVVTLPGGGAGASRPIDLLRPALASHLMLLRRSDGAVLVLCPMTSEAERIAVAERIGTLLPAAVLERTVLSTAQLGQLAPLSGTRDDDPVASIVS